MDAQDKDNLVKSSMEKAFGVKGNGDQMDLSSANLLSFLQVKTVIEKDQDGLYAEYIEKIRQQEKAEFERLEKIKERSEAEQQRLLEVSNSTLPAEEYYYLNLFNKQKAEGFAAENKELTDAWFKPLHEEVNEKAKELHKEYSKDNPNITFDICKAGALLSTFGDVLNDKRLKTALDVGKFMINPIGFTTSKVIGKVIGAALKTETGKNLISKAKDSWTSKFGESELSSKMNVPKVLGALATVGAIVTIATGLDTDTIGEIKNAFNETLETVSNAGSNLNIDNLLEAASNTDIDATNPYVMRAQEMMEAKYGAVEELAADVGVDPVELKQAAVQDAVLESGVDIKETIAAKAEAIANEAINLPESITIQSGDRLESLVKDMLPKDASYSDIREMTQKIAEFNGLADADHIMVGQEFKIPSGDVLKDIEIKDFKIESLDDLASLDKVPYGSSITPEEYAKQVEAVMKGAYPNEPDRVHEMMAHVNAKMNDLPAGQPIESGTKIDLGKDYKELLVEKSRMISDEQESMYDFTEKQSVEEPKVDAPKVEEPTVAAAKVEEPKVEAAKVEQAEPVAAKAAAPEQAAETLTKVEPFDRQNYSVNHNVQNSELNSLEVNGKQIDMENVPQEVKDILRLDQDELKQMRTERTLDHFRNKPDDYVSVRELEREELADFFENNPEAYERMMNNQPPLSAEPEVTLAAQKVEAPVVETPVVETPEIDDDVPQYMKQDAGRANFDAGELDEPEVIKPEVKVAAAAAVVGNPITPEIEEMYSKIPDFDAGNSQINYNFDPSTDTVKSLTINGVAVDVTKMPQGFKDLISDRVAISMDDPFAELENELELGHYLQNHQNDYKAMITGTTPEVPVAPAIPEADLPRASFDDIEDLVQNESVQPEMPPVEVQSIDSEDVPQYMTQDAGRANFDAGEMDDNPFGDEAPTLEEDVPQYMTQDAGRVNFDAGEMDDNPFGDEAPTLEEDVPQYMTQDAGRANFDAGEMDDNPFGDETPTLEEDVPQYMTQDAGRANFDAGEMDDNPFEGDIDPKVEELQTFVKDFNTSYTLDEQKDMIAAGYYIAEQRGIEVHDVSEAVKVAQDAHIDFVNAQGLNPLHFDETDFSSQVVDKAGINFDDDVPNFLANSVEPAYPEYSDVSPEEANLVVAKAEMLTANMDEKPYQTAEEAYEFVRSEHLKSMRDSGGVWMEDRNDMSMERSDIAKSFDGFVHDGVSHDDVENLPRYLEHPDTYQSPNPDDEIVNGLKSEVNKDQSLSNNDQNLNRRNGLRNS